ncbi:MAG: hypothetical protein AVDCRST_MAG25-1838, partial [uncultured Rubrobacteraceae bacterium]
ERPPRPRRPGPLRGAPARLPPLGRAGGGAAVDPAPRRRRGGRAARRLRGRRRPGGPRRGEGDGGV